MKKYRSHKVVEAAKIYFICCAKAAPNHFLCFGELLIEVSPEYMKKHQPTIGGYYVRYADGYESFSPAEAFESGYTAVEEQPIVHRADPELLPCGHPVSLLRKSAASWLSSYCELCNATTRIKNLLSNLDRVLVERDALRAKNKAWSEWLATAPGGKP